MSEEKQDPSPLTEGEAHLLLKRIQEELEPQIASLRAALSTHDSNIEKLKAQLAAAMTDNEVLGEQNAKLHELVTDGSKQVQEAAEFNDLLFKKAQRLESDVAELTRQRDQFKKGFDTQQRKNEELVERLKRQKLLEKPEPLPLG